MTTTGLGWWCRVFLASIHGNSSSIAAEGAAREADDAVRALKQRAPELSDIQAQVRDGAAVVIGDRVQVVRLAEEDEQNDLNDRWTGLWTVRHDESAGSFRAVIAICLPGNGIVLSNGLAYPPSTLVAV